MGRSVAPCPRSRHPDPAARRRRGIRLIRPVRLKSGPGGNRTHDLGIKSPLLYQLSYRPAVLAYLPGALSTTPPADSLAQWCNSKGFAMSEEPNTARDSRDLWFADSSRSLRRRGRSQATIALYRRSFDQFWHWAERRQLEAIEHVNRDEVNAYLDHLQDAGLAPSTVSLRWRNLRPFFAWWANGTDRPHPFDGTDHPRAVPPPLDVLSPEDVRALLATSGGRSFEDRRGRAVILTLLDTGGRRGELTGLRTDDWDRRTDLLTLDGKTWLRVVPVSPPVARRWPATCGPGPTTPKPLEAT